MLRSAVQLSFISLLLLLLTGCLVVKSDVAKLDDESGALTLEIDADSGDDSPPAEEPEVDPEEIAAQEEKVEELERKMAEMEIGFKLVVRRAVKIYWTASIWRWNQMPSEAGRAEAGEASGASRVFASSRDLLLFP